MKPRIPLAAALSARSLFDRQDLVTAVHMAAAIQFYLRRPDALAHSTRAALALLDQLLRAGTIEPFGAGWRLR